MKNRVLLIFLSIIFVFTFTTAGDVGAIEYLDGDLIIHGKISQQLAMRTKGKRNWELYDYDIYHLRSTFKLETRYKVTSGTDYDITFYSIFKNFYDAASSVDTGFRKYLRDFSGNSSTGINESRTYGTFTDICRELYVEVTNPNFQVRLGKQIVSWGEASFERMADIVNPIDGRGNLNPAYPDFDEIKRGLFMARLTITPPDFWQDIFFEFLVIPEFQPNVNWPAGHHFTHPEAFNTLANPNEIFRADYRDAPTSWKDPALGFRIRGLTYGFDWTVFYLYHRNPNAIVREGRGLQSQLPALLGIGRAENVKEFDRQNSFGFTFNRPVNKAITLFPGTSLNMSGNIWRGEFLVELNKNHNRGFTPEVRQHDRFAFVLGWDTYIQIPGLSTWNRNRKLQSSTQLFMEWVPRKKSDDFIYPWVTYAPGSRYADAITQSFAYDFWNSRIIPAVYASYAPYDGRYFIAPTLAFKPTFHWTYLVRYITYQNYGTEVQDLDNITFEVTYEF